MGDNELLPVTMEHKDSGFCSDDDDDDDDKSFVDEPIIYEQESVISWSKEE